MKGCHVTPPDMKKRFLKKKNTTSPSCLKETLVALSDSAENSRKFQTKRKKFSLCLPEEDRKKPEYYMLKHGDNDSSLSH